MKLKSSDWLKCDLRDLTAGAEVARLYRGLLIVVCKSKECQEWRGEVQKFFLLLMKSFQCESTTFFAQTVSNQPSWISPSRFIRMRRISSRRASDRGFRRSSDEFQISHVLALAICLSLLWLLETFSSSIVAIVGETWSSACGFSHSLARAALRTFGESTRSFFWRDPHGFLTGSLSF